MKPKKSNFSQSFPRRSFLKGIAATGAVSWMAPHMIFAATGRAAGSVSPGQKVNLACVGIGNRGADVVKSLNATGLANIVALCDVDMGNKQTLPILKQFPDVPRFQDFRVMFDKMGKQIDAVSIAVPDFAHFPIAMLSMSLGKHIYCEKPMAHTFQEVELMMQAEKKYKVAAQMGNQGHSDGNYYQFKAWTEAGIIKNVTRIDAFMNSSRRWHGMKVSGLLPGQPVPETLDWDTWLGTAQPHPYNIGYHQGDWRSWFDFGNGALGDWGAHLIDTAHEFLKLGLPTTVTAKTEGHSDFIFPQATTLVFKFPKRGDMPPVDLTWYDGVNNLPPLPDNFGRPVADSDVPPPSSGTIDTKKNPPGKVIYGEGLTFKGGSHGSKLRIIPEAREKEMQSKLPTVPPNGSNHFANLLRAAKGEEKCRSSFAVAGPLCQAMALGIIAQQRNGQVVFDPATRRITNDKIADALLQGPPPRKGWEQYYKL